MSTAIAERTTTPARSKNPAVDVRALRHQRKLRSRLVIPALAVALVLAIGIRVLLGSYSVTIPDFFSILMGHTIPGAGGARFIVLQEKLPHAVLGALAGLAFGCAGAIFQLLLRNPLASPDIIGINASSSLGAVAALAFFGASSTGMAVGGLLGAVACAVVIFGLSVGRDGLVGNRFVLIGLGVAVLAIALANYLLSRINIYQAADAAIWLTGSLGSANWSRITMLAVVLLILLPLSAILTRNLHAMEVGDDLARGLGVPVAATRWVYIGLAVVMVAFAVAVTGPITFVAFVSGPIARKLIGGRHSLVASALIGAIIVVLADFAAAELIPGGRLPVGVVTGVVGAPILLWLVASANKERS
ncbi:FecCD family ABC transporter permease [Kocuria sp. HSID16901]|uniref:FecCD family ABC transporter permease n=1 Tax=Kocuria sp. HSID16901 TaxID=2419505 RepID=UPI000F885EF7|nr:iron ABC transporter permease [Kocuria sp. HSID16901]MCT1368217.1 iron ABC transporter permease [Rothia sp. p3-SID1597]RUQ23222.1 iron ABC transporter permease [Kocuria sp. HSID16901]